MKIALVSSFVPFVYGGGRNIVDWLAPKLEDAGHEVEIIYLPFTGEPERLFAQLAAYRTIDLTDRADLVVCLRPPAHFVQHPRKVLWFIHHLRGYYDLWDTTYRGFPDTSANRSRRDSLRVADGRAFAEAHRIFTNSAVVSARLRDYNAVASEVLYPPVIDPQRFHDAGTNDTVVYLARLEHHKRQHLIVEALAHTQSAVRVQLVGTATSRDYPDELRLLAATLGVEDRVSIEDRWISEEEKVDILSHSLALAYFPLDEDSYGYPTIEASLSGKAILTTEDSGGVLELVDDGRTGLVVRARPEDVGAALDRLYLDRKLTQKLGVGAKARLEELDINWDHVVQRIVS